MLLISDCMRPTIDTDNSFSSQGRILSLVRGRPEGSDDDRKTLVTLVIQSEKDKHVVDLPIETRTDFDVIPYQSALVGVDAKYSKKYERWQEGIAINWELEVLSGALKGNTYKFSRA